MSRRTGLTTHVRMVRCASSGTAARRLGSGVIGGRSTTRWGLDGAQRLDFGGRVDEAGGDSECMKSRVVLAGSVCLRIAPPLGYPGSSRSAGSEVMNAGEGRQRVGG